MIKTRQTKMAGQCTYWKGCELHRAFRLVPGTFRGTYVYEPGTLYMGAGRVHCGAPLSVTGTVSKHARMPRCERRMIHASHGMDTFPCLAMEES